MAPITLSGFNNIDFKSIINIIIQSERQPIDSLQARQKTEQSRLDAYGTLNTTLSTVQSAFAALKDSSAFGDLKAVSSDTATLAVSATQSASKGTFNVDVISLARPQVTASAARQFNDINAAIIDGGSFSLTQNGATASIDLNGVTTLAQLRDAINAQQSGVKASIVNDGSTADSPAKPFRLLLTSATAGVASAFTFDDETTLGGGTPGAVLNLSTDSTNGVAKDTEVKYNGISIKSTSTTVADAIPGLTLTLFKTGSATVTISDDQSSLRDKVISAVDAFNTFNDFVRGQFKLPASGTDRPPLAVDPLLRGMNRQIRSYFTSDHANSGGIANFAGLGITLDQSGKLMVDGAALDAALAGSPGDVKNFLSGANGFASKVSDYLKSNTLAGGSIDSVETRIKTTIDSYAKKIISMESELTLREDTLTRQFAAADQAISQLNSQANALTSLGSQYRLF